MTIESRDGGFYFRHAGHEDGPFQDYFAANKAENDYKLQTSKPHKERITNKDWRGAPPPKLITRIVKEGGLAWNAAGRGWNEYYMHSGTEKLTGPLADFLRDLIACCNGTHEWVAKPARYMPKYAPPPPARLGDGLTMTAEALVKAIKRQEAFYRKYVLPHRTHGRNLEPGPPAEELLDRFDRRYLPVADKLLTKHGLTVPEWRRAKLARLIAGMREHSVKTVEVMKKVEVWNGFHTADDKLQVEITEEERPVLVEAPKQKNQHTPVPALESARKHLRKLLVYTKQPPAHKERVAGRCACLREALSRGGALTAVALTLECTDGDSLYGEGGLLDALKEGHVKAEELERWLARIDRIL